MAYKRGQSAGNAAAFVAILTVLIIVYILFLPPDIRTELLGDSSSTSGTNNGNGVDSNSEEILKQSVGKITYINNDEKIYDLPTTRIYSPTTGQVLKSIPSVYIKYALFDTEKSKYEFNLNIDKSATKNVVLSYNVREYNGPLIISLNNEQIFNSEVESLNPRPITLDSSSLLSDNTIAFSVPSPGWLFWTTNKYTLETIQVTGDVTDYSNSVGIQHFIISQAEKDNLESIKLFFYPNCDISDVGSLRIELNNRPIYNSVADCGTRTFATLNTNEILAGSNELRFYSVKGSYTLDNMYIKTTMNEPAYKTYYFDLKDEYFTFSTTTPVCGDYDGNCPSGCDESKDSDCCFKRNGYWCALPTLNVNDRCRFYVAFDDCTICKTGFYNRYSNTADNCEDTCGDNNDDTCADGCPEPKQYYDKDCCFAENPDNYWCKETPITGISDKCKPSISPSECDLCPSGYINEDGSKPQSCTTTNFEFEDEEYILSDNYEIKLNVRFVDSTSRKRVDFNVNGHTFRIDTTGSEYSKIINDYVKTGTNSIEIIPVNEDVNIAEIKVTIRRVS
ncbi:MAG: hypothetical protein ACP5N1_01490 [Candidatus Woesearchaeota archaeon]